MDVEVTIAEDVRDLALGIVVVTGARISESGEELRAACDAAAKQAAAEGCDGGEPRRAAVRQLLRYGGFKPAGRSKPAQEYLLRTAVQEGALPAISNVVDVINAASLSSGLPISLLSLDRLGPRVLVRYGADGEQFVFNRAGQQLDVRGLLCLSTNDGGASRPLGSPVKDSMAGKIDERDRDLLACMYAPQSAVSRETLEAYCRRMSDDFSRWCAAEACTVRIIPATWAPPAGGEPTNDRSSPTRNEANRQ